MASMDTMDTLNRYADNAEVCLHYLDSQASPATSLAPLVYVPGMLGSAEVFADEVPHVAPRRCLAISSRGRGKSAAPPAGYAFADQVSDLAAVIAHAGLDRCCLMAFSVGVAFALGYACAHPERVQGLVIIDYAARYPQLTHEWAERAVARGATHRVEERVVHALWRESEEIPLWRRLGALACPTSKGSRYVRICLVGGRCCSACQARARLQA
jgi:pimeloyl-ACP methyl ester carboxylesterase